MARIETLTPIIVNEESPSPSKPVSIINTVELVAAEELLLLPKSIISE